MKKCRNCNFENQDNSQFCGKCGAPLTSTVKQRSAQKPQKEKLYKRTGFTVFMLLFAYPIGAVLMWMYRKFFLSKRRYMGTEISILSDYVQKLDTMIESINDVELRTDNC